ncbi:uncharacterized protein LOC122069033 [Macadamia integrifolia]|uniref:uncharacterized protein LOC122069033 n=1 Tax=Macadamia integrifolia TaxID=60698 RepID=UPI001C4FEFCA|nr:uncharacterized protein LOC122069033 [Macadamia integrifolia]
MERIKTGMLMMFITVLMVLIPKIMSATPTSPRPLCMSQFALVNHACSLLPFRYRIPHLPVTKDAGHEQVQVQQKKQEDQAQLEGECDHEHGHEHENRESVRHRHSHRHHHEHLDVEVDCCRWLKEIDTICVCEVLFHLPPFLQAPKHSYTVSVGEECEITYPCPGRSG